MRHLHTLNQIRSITSAENLQKQFFYYAK